jgi:dihydrofolate synthase/folylpolyglutamate synthase
MSTKNFQNFANSFQAIARLRLESIECLLKHLNNPQNSLKFIHIAGTNGKGSVCSFLQNIFSAAGYRTGKYTSPNLISVCERISIDGVLISEPELSLILAKVEEGVSAVVEELGESPTQFEIWTASAFLYFKEKKCDIVILETGLGGTRDATNIIPPPLAAIITQLDIDHTEYLGNTIEAIATEKAGIIKEHPDNKTALCITSSRQSPKAMAVLSEVCSKTNNQLVVASDAQNCKSKGFNEVFDYVSSDEKVIITNIICGISGYYQPENAVLAIECALQLGILPQYIKDGIKAAKNPGRFEIISSDPLVIYDGAHNKNGIMALISCLKRYFPDWHGANFIMAFMGDKDIGGSLEQLKKSGLMDNSNIFAVQVKNNPRAIPADKLCEMAQHYQLSAIPYSDLKEAYQVALTSGKPTILCGSLYLYKDFDEVLKAL